MLTCSGPANAGSTNGSLGLCCINLAISRATARWKHLRWRSERPGKRLSDIPASCVSQERIFVISRAAKGSKDSQVSQALDWDVFFSKASRRTLRAQAFPAPAQHVGRCWELHSYDRTPRPLPREAKNRSFYNFSEPPYPPLPWSASTATIRVQPGEKQKPC